MATIESIRPNTNPNSLAKNKPWHQVGFIPQIKFHNTKLLEAFRKYDVSPKVAMVNYHDLVEHDFLSDSKLKKMHELIGPVDALIMNSIGRDRQLDRMTVEDYHYVILEIGAKAAFTIDDYIYAYDNKFPNYQMGNFGRAIRRTKQLVDLAQNDYSIIGLVFGKDENWMQIHVDSLTELGIHDFAFSSGDLWKGNSRDKHKQIKSFLTTTNDVGGWNMLVGFDTERELLNLKPQSFSSMQWIFDGSTYMVTKNGKRIPAKYKNVRLHDGSYTLQDRRLQLALHNLIENYHIGLRLTM